MQGLQGSEIRELLKLTQQPQIISLLVECRLRVISSWGNEKVSVAVL